MARLNQVHLYARVHKKPTASINRDTGEYNYSMCYLDVVRSLRKVDDNVKFVKHDHPLLFTREKPDIEQMLEWEENDIVSIFGVITTRKMAKTSFCTECGEKNIAEGNLVYVTPIHMLKIKSYLDDEEVKSIDNEEEAHHLAKQKSIEDITTNREISNQITIEGTLITEPKLVTTKQNVKFTQYRMALNRKYVIKTDDPSVRTDWPIVKSYGEQAISDKLYLKYQADIIIDGFLQARTVTRKCKCVSCDKLYEWKDKTMELVPYDVEYVDGFRTKEDIERERQQTVEAITNELFNKNYKDEFTGIDSDLAPEEE